MSSHSDLEFRPFACVAGIVAPALELLLDEEATFPPLVALIDENGKPTEAGAVWALACAIKQHADALRLTAMCNTPSAFCKGT